MLDEISSEFTVLGFTKDVILVASELVETLVVGDEIRGVGRLDVEKYELEVLDCDPFIEDVSKFIFEDGLTTDLVVEVG